MLSLNRYERSKLWAETINQIEAYFNGVARLPVSPELNPSAIRQHLATLDFSEPLDPTSAVRIAADGLTRWQVHTSHPAYFGLFNPSATPAGVAADALVAGFNPQMAAWSHNPFANEVERHLVRALGSKFGYTEADGTFCSGGMEANHTAVLTAIVSRFPAFLQDGAASLKRPVLYASAESHHSILKSARLTGLGTNAVRLVPVDDKLRMSAVELRRMLQQDRDAGRTPFLVVATAGTTSAGAIDPLPEIAELCNAEDLWMHTDAAWGGAAALVPELRGAIAGIESSDSITFDAHKWLSVPMGAGLYLTRHPDILDRTFRVQTAYMPQDAAALDIVDPHLHSMQWSRRFIGLKVFLSLLIAGWDGYAAVIRHQTAMGNYLRKRLGEEGWEITNDTPLPLVCFVNPGDSPEHLRLIANHVVASGRAWCSPTVTNGRTVIRACITHYETREDDVETLISALSDARRDAEISRLERPTIE